MAQSTPLADTIRAAGASFVDVAGFELPDHFGNATEEYDAALTGTVLFDRSSSGKIEVTGKEAPDFLHNLSTNDVKGLPIGGGCEAFFCNVRARALFLAGIYHRRADGRDSLWIDVGPGQNIELFKHLDKHLIAEQAELADRTAEFAQVHVAGPRAVEVLATVLNSALPALEPYQHMERMIGSAAVQIHRHDPLGVTGFDVVVDNMNAPDIWDALVAAGARSAGQTVWEWLRIEAGTPERGHEFDENRFVVETWRTNAISYTKGCYLGQEPIVMARDRAGFVARSLRGLRLSSDTTAGTKLFAPDDVGVITSTTRTPGLGAIAMAYLRRGFETAGTTVHIGAADGPAANVVELPIRPITN